MKGICLHDVILKVIDLSYAAHLTIENKLTVNVIERLEFPPFTCGCFILETNRDAFKIS